MKKIMIIEDNKDLQDIYKYSFEKYGYETIVEPNGIEGVLHVAEKMPDVILLDLMMPGMDGFAFLKQVKATGGISVPIIVCSNISNAETISQVIKDGAEAVLLKVDYSGKQLVEKVEHLVKEFHQKHNHSNKTAVSE